MKTFKIMVEIFSQDHFLANGDGNPIMYMLLTLGKMSKYALIFLELIKNEDDLKKLERKKEDIGV